MQDSPYDIKSSMEITKRLYEIEQEETSNLTPGRFRELLYEKKELLQELQYIYDNEYESSWNNLLDDSESILLYTKETFENYLARKNSKFSLRNTCSDKNPWIIIKCPTLKLKGQLSFEEVNSIVGKIIEDLQNKVSTKFEIRYCAYLLDNTKKNVQFHLDLQFIYK